MSFGRWFGGFCALVLTAGFLLGSTPAAQADGPEQAETARLLGYLWADGSYSNGVWDATAPSGARSVLEELVEVHGGLWEDRAELVFRLPAPYDWQDWTDSLPNNDATTRAAVLNPHFLAALIEGEGEVGGVIYDQDTCCTAGFTRGRMTELRDLLSDTGYVSAQIRQTGNVDSGDVSISTADFGDLRQDLRFVCPARESAIRVPGGGDHDAHGDIRWFGDGTRWETLVRTDCVAGQSIDVVSAPNGECVLQLDPNGQVTVSWTFDHGRVSIIRNGQTRTQVSAADDGWQERPASATHEYRLQVVFAGAFRTIPCGSIDAQTAVAPPTCRNRQVTMIGTERADALWGTPGPDVIDARGGDDTIHGLEGDDVICAGAGSDRVMGGGGRDAVTGGRGWDLLRGGSGRDRLSGSAGNDTLIGESGNDRLIGDPGDDLLDGGGGRDRLYGRAGDDRLAGGRDRDICVGGRGTDSFSKACESPIP
jgi:Ca2+-binding RTX toxin-like protein